ncbi:MAG: polyprenol monophosphomannose synthase [Candidatus Kerfeldbacteria bacterium]|nr:polyprenol monophosphomannose synthase [Candidatus Kerfeldbacteria bacterium]
MKIWLVIPTYNEAANIASLLAALFDLPLDLSPHLLAGCWPCKSESASHSSIPVARPRDILGRCGDLSVVVVDDNSPDQTAAQVKLLQEKYPGLYLVKRPRKLGLGSAYRAGFKFALEHGAEVVGEMDADWSHSPSDVLRLVAAFRSGAEVAIGSRRIKGGQIIGWAWYRHFMSFGATTFARLVLGLKTRDITAGFRLYTKGALNKIPWQSVQSDGYAWQEEMIFLCERARLKIIEVPVIFKDRQQGKSKLKLKDVIEFFVNIFRLRLK